MMLTTTNKHIIPIKMFTKFLDLLSSFSKIYISSSFSS